MKNLMTRKLLFGMLMTLVLAFSVQGIADALTLMETSPIVQSKREGSTFEITFRVGLTGNRVQNHPDYSNRRISANDHTAPYDYIDSSGYAVTYIGETSRSYRNITTNPTGTLVVDPRPTYSTNSDGSPANPAAAGSPSGTYLVDTSGNVYDTDGDPVYVQTGTGTRDDTDTDTNENNPWRYTRAKATPSPITANESARHDYNDEAIGITFPTAAGTVKLKNPSFIFGSIDTPADLGASYTGNTSLQERVRVGLPSSVTLVCEGAAVGTHEIVIWDATNDNDFPLDGVPDANQPRQSITFTLHVTPSTTTIADDAEIEPDIQRIAVEDSVEPVSEHLTFPTSGNYRIRYEVVRGSGTLYVGTLEDQHTTPNSVISVHQGSAVFLNTNGSSNEVHVWFAGEDRSAPRATIVFEYRGQPVPTTRTPPTTTTTPPTTNNPTLTLSSSTLTGTASSNVQLAATVRNRAGNTVQGIGVTFTLSETGSGAISPSTAITNANGVAQTTVTLPNVNATVTVRATVEGVSLSQQASITITGTTATTGTGTTTTTTTADLPDRIVISGDSSFTGERNRRLSDTLSVRVVDSNGNGVSGETVFFRIVEGRGRLSPARTRTDNSGYAEAGFTPLTDGTIEIEAASGDLSPVTFTVTTGEPPDAIVVVSGNNQSGRPGRSLANPFVVEVIDANDDPVSGVTVTFAVTAGGGSVSPASATTNNNGRAQTTLTLGSEPGENTVAARVAGITGVTFKATSGAQVLVKAALRPPMYWVGKANGTLHRLVGEETENLAPNVQGVTSIAVDSANGHLYFAVQTGANRGTIRRAGLNGAGAQTLKKLTAAPMGIAVDSAGGTVYWTNSRGRIQSIATEGSAKITNVLMNLSSPGAIALSNGYLYWGEATGRVRRMSLTAEDAVPENLATGLGEPLSIAIAKGKVYWIERSSGGSGSLQRANLNGSSIQELKTFVSGVPTSLAVDGASNRIYWTRSTGKIQRSNLAGKFVKDIATGLMNPGSIALGTAAEEEAPVVEQTTQRRQPTQQTTQTADTSKYDVNGDGSVDNIDLTLVAIALGSDNLKYDVNGDGSVDADDVRAVSDAISDAAAAPAINVDLKGLDIDFDRVQEEIEMLLAAGDLSIEGQRVLRYLQHLLASARPSETVLLANYPNPFNPETWIPYHLATSTDVRINIYDAQGVLVRALTLGHQVAGYYTSRSRAAYWDGRNALGERVASGIYFYQLQTDEVSPMRKMVILK